MTHCYVELEASARCNLILGPNGAGKSSIVCALALGLSTLAVHRTVLRRSQSLDDFIRRGADVAQVHVRGRRGRACARAATARASVQTRGRRSSHRRRSTCTTPPACCASRASCTAATTPSGA
jgi:recombinational DNA repair ATPase RecF